MGAISNITTAGAAGAALASSIPALSNIIMASPQIQNTIGYQPQAAYLTQGIGPNPLPPALIFHYEGEQTVHIECDITDNFVEDNTAIQDQIAIKPEVITTHGFIGDLNDVPPNKSLAIAQVAAQKLQAINGFFPVVSVTALIAYNESLLAYQTANNVLNSSISAYNSIPGLPGSTGGGESV